MKHEVALVNQSQSRLLQLPLELRREIYAQLFSSITLTFRERFSTSKFKSVPYPLAFLSTCRQISEEIGDTWIGSVLWSFESSEGLLDRLSPLSPTRLAQIKHVRTGGKSLMLTPPDHEDDVYYRLVWALKLLPGLRLHQLTVLDTNHAEVDYHTLDGLIRYGDGWQELKYIARNSSMLSFPRLEMLRGDPYWRKPQPSSWIDVLQERDGVDSRPSVVIYRSTVADSLGSVLDKRSRYILEQPVPDSGVDTFGIEEDKDLSGPGEAGKELCIEVRRGKNADISQRDGPSYSPADMREWTGSMSWSEIRRVSIDYFYDEEDSDYNDFLEIGSEFMESDEYGSVEE
ncbi:hypothetical protein F5884DRAFT_760127 [Xylogone sp. PMI_703]|nr:hypothetical protein F5884DRAFT_760127 [Xylogone sp. PMI_703]